MHSISRMPFALTSITRASFMSMFEPFYVTLHVTNVTTIFFLYCSVSLVPAVFSVPTGQQEPDFSSTSPSQILELNAKWLSSTEEVGPQIQTLVVVDLPPIVQQIPCNLWPQRRVPASQLRRENSGLERKCGTFSLFQIRLVLSVVSGSFIIREEHTSLSTTCYPTLPSFIISSVHHKHSHLLTSGSLCLGNKEVVRYLYRILMSSCSSPLLQVQPHTHTNQHKRCPNV